MVMVMVMRLVLFLAIGTLLAASDGATARGEVLPEKMGVFSIRAFSAFLFALAAAILSLVPSRFVAPYRSLGSSGCCWISRCSREQEAAPARRTGNRTL